MAIEISDTFKITGQQIASMVGGLSSAFDKTASKGEQIGGLIQAINTAVLIIRDAITPKGYLDDAVQAQEKFYNAVAANVGGINYQLERQLDLLDDLYGENRYKKAMELYDDMGKKQEGLLKMMQGFDFTLIESATEMLKDPIFGIDSKND